MIWKYVNNHTATKKVITIKFKKKKQKVIGTVLDGDLPPKGCHLTFNAHQ